MPQQDDPELVPISLAAESGEPPEQWCRESPRAMLMAIDYLTEATIAAM